MGWEGENRGRKLNGTNWAFPETGCLARELRQFSGALASQPRPLSATAVALDLCPSLTPGACGRSVELRSRRERDAGEASLLEVGDENTRLSSSYIVCSDFGEGSRRVRKEKETRIGAWQGIRGQGLAPQRSARPRAARRPLSARLPRPGPAHSPG